MEGHDGRSFEVEVLLDLSMRNGEPPSGEAIRRLIADQLALQVERKADFTVRRVVIRPRREHG